MPSQILRRIACGSQRGGDRSESDASMAGVAVRGDLLGGGDRDLRGAIAAAARLVLLRVPDRLGPPDVPKSNMRSVAQPGGRGRPQPLRRTAHPCGSVRRDTIGVLVRRHLLQVLIDFLQVAVDLAADRQLPVGHAHRRLEKSSANSPGGCLQIRPSGKGETQHVNQMDRPKALLASPRRHMELFFDPLRAFFGPCCTIVRHCADGPDVDTAAP